MSQKKKRPLSNEEFEMISKIAEEHSKKVFGYLDSDDLKNEIWAICLSKINEYDKERGELEHFLRVLVSNRLVNRFKDITKSVRSPCPRCPYYEPSERVDCAKYGEEKNLCKKWRNYQLSIVSRNSLLNASEDLAVRSSDSDVFNKIVGKELRDKVRELLNDEFRKDFDDFIDGNKISRQRIKRLRKEVARLLPHLVE